MFAIGFILMFTFAYLEAFNFKKISFNLEIKNVLTFSLHFTGFLISIIIFLISINFNLSSPIIKENIVLLQDWRFYIIILSEILGAWLFRKNYEVNGDNLTAINFALFLSLALVPMYSYFFSALLGFDKTIMIGYQSPLEFYIFTGLILLSVVVFFFDKLKGKINNIFLLFSLPVVFSNNMFITSKIMQTYDPFFSYSIILFFISLLFFVMAFINKEFNNVNKSHFKLISYLSLSWIIAIPLNIIAVKLLAVEFITLLKRVSQLISGFILDKIYNKNNNKFSVKDYFIIFFILFLGLSLYILRG